MYKKLFTSTPTQDLTPHYTLYDCTIVGWVWSPINGLIFSTWSTWPKKQRWTKQQQNENISKFLHWRRRKLQFNMSRPQTQCCQTTTLRSLFRSISSSHHICFPGPRGRLTGLHGADFPNQGAEAARDYHLGHKTVHENPRHFHKRFFKLGYWGGKML